MKFLCRLLLSLSHFFCFFAFFFFTSTILFVTLAFVCCFVIIMLAYDFKQMIYIDFAWLNSIEPWIGTYAALARLGGVILALR